MKKAVLGILLLTIGAGCAAISIKHPLQESPRTPLAIPYCMEITAQPNIFHKALSAKENTALFERETQTALADIRNTIDSIEGTAKNPDSLIMRYQESCVPDQQKPEEVKKVDLFLRIELTGYGSLPKKWKQLLIGSGIVEGVVQGVVVFSVTQNMWLGLGVALEEFTSEFLAWNGVDWILGTSYAPVSIKGILTRNSDKKVIWQNSFFVTENEDELKELSKQEKKDKGKRLLASLHKAKAELLASLIDYFEKNILDDSTLQ